MAKRVNVGREKMIAVVVMGGATRGGAGWGITASGKIIKIPPNNPLAGAVKALAEGINKTLSGRAAT
jgi:hypothetical protein